MDRVDAILLSELQNNNRLTAEVLAHRVGLSSTACQRRIRRLRETGVIEADVAILNPKAVGQTLMMLVAVTLERDRTDIIDRFKQAIRRQPEIVQAFYVTGESDFVLLVAARDMDDYDQFTRRFFQDHADIKSFKTAVVMDRVKYRLAVPVA
jgi:Lrp/AsnC family leucine-responsive transcriptional regulator